MSIITRKVPERRAAMAASAGFAAEGRDRRGGPETPIIRSFSSKNGTSVLPSIAMIVPLNPCWRAAVFRTIECLSACVLELRWSVFEQREVAHTSSVNDGAARRSSERLLPTELFTADLVVLVTV